ncbi:hypothetical protein FOA52_004729 [Chlamydomonas sp. UWO 241]|nr:hypothetical protein FOA52_004729 [Chlamydomonas sp. UWO 241]
MDALGLGYGSSDEEGPPQDSDSSADDSLDSAQRRAVEAEARLRDFHKEERRAPTTALPSAFSAFGEVDGPPAFLDPEATRQLARAPASLGRSGLAADGSAGSGAPGAAGRMKPGADFDLSLLAPKLKGDHKRQTGDTRELSKVAVIEGKAKRNRTDGGPEASQAYSAATIALLGGKVNEDAGGSGGNGGGGPSRASEAGPRVPSAPMPVSEFLNKGGGQLMPRKAQDRRDKEKDKRLKGQSAIGSWKSEAEMVLRQQYD